MDRRAYWIWLQHAFGAGSRKPWMIQRRFQGGAEEFWSGKAMLWNSMKFVSDKEARLLSSFSVSQAEIVLEMCEKLGHTVLTPESADYPELLRNIDNPPAVLYARGSMPDVDETPAVAVVGTRRAQPRSLDAAMTVSYQLAVAGAVVVSGGALGVDAAAHRGAMRGMGKTVCVLPCGLDNGYLIENYALREKIAENGILLTEYPHDTGVAAGTFQVRNRLISGLSCASLVVEAGRRSGALITAKYAKEQNRDVFVYIGDPDDAAFAGCRSLLQDGAKQISSGDEILEEYRLRFTPREAPRAPRIIKEKQAAPSAPGRVKHAAAQPVLADAAKAVPAAGADDSHEQILRALTAEAVHISEIGEKTGLPAHKLLAALTQLELEGRVKAFSGRRYALL